MGNNCTGLEGDDPNLISDTQLELKGYESRFQKP